MGCHRLRAYIDKELNPLSRLLMRLHIAFCPSCGKMIEEGYLSREIHRLEGIPVPPALRDKLLADAISAAREQASSPIRRTRAQGIFTMKGLAIASAVAVLLVVAILGRFTYSPPQKRQTLAQHKQTNAVKQAHNPTGKVTTKIRPHSEHARPKQHPLLEHPGHGLSAVAKGEAAPDTSTPVTPASLVDKTRHPVAQQPGPPVVVILSAKQPVTDGVGRTLKAGDRLSVGASVRTGRGGRVALVTRKGSELHLDSNSELLFSSDKIATISRGRMYCSNRDKEIAEIITPAGRVHLLGTVVDTAVVRTDAVAVTVVEGAVQLSNEYGTAQVQAGNKSVLVASKAPESGVQVNTRKETQWYHGRWDVESCSGDLVYTLERGAGVVTEVWTKRPDGSGRVRLHSYLDKIELLSWDPGQRWIEIRHWNEPYRLRDPAHGATNEFDDRGFGGGWMLPWRELMLDAVTGESWAFQPVPEGRRPSFNRRSLSPDSTRTVFMEWVQEGTPPWKLQDVFVQDWTTDRVTKVFTGDIVELPAWAPDSRHIAVSATEGDILNKTTSIVDTYTGEEEFVFNGAGARFSPDGRKLVYCADFQPPFASFNVGVPPYGCVYVMDIAPVGRPVRVAPGPNGTRWAATPVWAPDSRRILYRDTVRFRLCIVGDDGVGRKSIYAEPNDMRFRKASWAPSGDAVYVTIEDSSKVTHLLLVAADGSSVTEVLNDSSENNKLPRNFQAQTDAAVAAAQEAAQRFALGHLYICQALLPECREEFKAAADIYAGLVWNYPLSGLDQEDTLRHADACTGWAITSDDDLLAESCRRRQRRICVALEARIIEVSKDDRAVRQLPQNTTELEEYLRTPKWDNPYLPAADTLWCPGTTDHDPVPFDYMPPPLGYLPEEGDEFIRCPLHQEENWWNHWHWSSPEHRKAMMEKWGIGGNENLDD